MTASEIRHGYRIALTIGYDAAIVMLMRLGFTEYAADKYLFAEG